MLAYQITVFFTTKHNSITFGTYFNDSMQTVYAGGSGSGGSQQREVADGADVVYTHTTPLKSQSGADVFYPNVL